MAYGGSQAMGLIGAIATSLCQSHSNMGSELCLQPTPQLMAMPDAPGALLQVPDTHMWEFDVGLRTLTPVGESL